MQLIIILFFLLFFYLSWRRLEWAVVFTIIALPAYLIRFKVFGLPSTLLEVMIITVFIIWFLKNYKNIYNAFKFKIVVDYPFKWEIILLLLVSFIAVGVAGFSNSAFGIWKAYFFEPILLFIVVINVFKYNANDVNEVRMTRMNENTNKTNIEPNKRMSGVEKIILSLAVSALIISALAVYQKITGQFIDNPLWAAVQMRRVVSFFGYPNAVGLYLGPVALLLFGWLIFVISTPILSGKKSLKDGTMIKRFLACLSGRQANARNDKIKIIFISITIIFSLLSIYFAKSEGALAGVATGLVVFGLLAGKKARLITLGLLVVSISAIFIYQPARELAIKKITLMDLSGQIRKQQWHESWQMLKDGRLITGAGLANFQVAVAPFHQEGIFVKNDDPNWLANIRASAEYRRQVWQPLEIYLYPHNIILNFWSELGLTGMLLFIWLILKYFFIGIRNLLLRKENKYIVLGLISAMVVIVVHGLVDVPYFKNDLAVMFWLLLAMMGIINLKNKIIL